MQIAYCIIFSFIVLSMGTTSTSGFTIRNILGKQLLVVGKHLYTRLEEPMSSARKYINAGMIAFVSNLSLQGIKSTLANQKEAIQYQRTVVSDKIELFKRNLAYHHRRRYSSASFIRDAVKTVGPSVTRIDCEYLTEEPNQSINKKDIIPIRTSGSGFVMSEDGYILTNAHVVNKAQKIVVTLANGRIFKANMVACDELTDLAVLKVDFSGSHIKLKKAPLGDSSKLQSGDWLIAVGCPAGLDFTVTLGMSIYSIYL